MKLTHIDNCTHGYLKVRKDVIKRLGYPIMEKGASGISKNHVYFEEDVEATDFLKYLEGIGKEWTIKEVYKPNFRYNHNYSVEKWFATYQVGDVFDYGRHKDLEIVRVDRSTIFLKNNCLPLNSNFNIW